jgi:beta-glucosidase/6-phospho-beta-glucosidase/beta-galactosidase
MAEDALAIYQDVLDRTSEALIAGDATVFLRHIHLPHRIITENGEFEVPDMTTALRHFDGFASALSAQGVDSYVRSAKHAAFVEPGRILGRHVAHITSKGKLVTPAFENQMELELRGGIWGARFVRHHARFVAYPDILPRGGAE